MCLVEVAFILVIEVLYALPVQVVDHESDLHEPEDALVDDGNVLEIHLSQLAGAFVVMHLLLL